MPAMPPFSTVRSPIGNGRRNDYTPTVELHRSATSIRANMVHVTPLRCKTVRICNCITRGPLTFQVKPNTPRRAVRQYATGHAVSMTDYPTGIDQSAAKQ